MKTFFMLVFGQCLVASMKGQGGISIGQTDPNAIYLPEYNPDKSWTLLPVQDPVAM